MVAPGDSPGSWGTAIAHPHGLVIAGASAADIADEFGTPVLVYDENELRSRAAEAAAAFDEGVAYATKAFTCTAMARLAVDSGLHLDVASDGELDVALAAAVDPLLVRVHGNNKSRAEIDRAVRVGVGAVVLDSDRDVELLAAAAARAGRVVDVLLRVTPGIDADTHPHNRTAGSTSKFGVPLAAGAADALLTRIARTRSLSLRGLHIHLGSGLQALDGYASGIEAVAPLVARHALQELCVGGGLGVSSAATAAGTPTIAQWGACVRAAAAAAGVGAAVRLTAEPGRSIVSRAGCTLYRVGTVKQRGRRTIVAVDGGMSDNIRPALYGADLYTALHAGPVDDRPSVSASVVGKNCESGDLLVGSVELAEPREGDLLFVPNTGAYCYSLASSYNRLPRPAVVFVRDGRAQAVLRRETSDDMLRLDEGAR